MGADLVAVTKRRVTICASIALGATFRSVLPYAVFLRWDIPNDLMCLLA